MSDLNKTIMQHAQKQVGIWEWAGSENNPLVLAMFTEAGHSDIKQDAVPWCAAFVGSVLLRAGTKGTGSLLARSYLDRGQKIPLSEAAGRTPGNRAAFKSKRKHHPSSQHGYSAGRGVSHSHGGRGGNAPRGAGYADLCGRFDDAGGCLCSGHAWRVFMGRCQTEIKPEDPRFKSAGVSALKHKGD